MSRITYLPLLDMAARLGRAEILPGFAVSFTPVLLDQLADPRFKRGFKNYLATHARVAEEERLIRGRRKESGLVRLQQMWRDYYSNALSYFSDTLREDLPGAFRRAAGDGAFELMTSAATHGYLPLIGLDENVRAQIELAIAAHQRHFGASPRGFWLPECGFRPAGHWWPPVHHGKLGDHDRRGVDDFLREAGIDYFFADQPQLGMSPPDYPGQLAAQAPSRGPARRPAAAAGRLYSSRLHAQPAGLAIGRGLSGGLSLSRFPQKNRARQVQAVADRHRRARRARLPRTSTIRCAPSIRSALMRATS